MPITQSMTFTATPPTTGESPTVFNANAIACWNELKITTIPNLNTAFTQMNALESNVNAKEISAVSASASAVMAANFQGTWTNQLTSVGQSWEYSGVIYGVLVAGTSSPITTPPNWIVLTTAQAIKNTPSGLISATTVQDAINELDTDKANSGYTNYRNRIINGANNVSQINADAAVTVTAGAALQYVIDQWYAYCTGANVTGQRIAGTLQSKYRYQYTGAASVTKIGHAQRMEAINTYDMNGKSTMVGVDMSNSLLTSVTWTAWYANTADTFGTLATPTRTQIGTGTITVSPTLARKYIPISIPSAATTGIEIEFSVGAQISGTWVIGNVQFEKVPTGATQGTDYEWLSYDEELRRCQRYYQKVYATIRLYASNATVYNSVQVDMKTTMRTTPTLVATATHEALLNVSVVNIFSSGNDSIRLEALPTAIGETYVLQKLILALAQL